MFQGVFEVFEGVMRFSQSVLGCFFKCFPDVSRGCSMVILAFQLTCRYFWKALDHHLGALKGLCGAAERVGVFLVVIGFKRNFKRKNGKSFPFHLFAIVLLFHSGQIFFKDRNCFSRSPSKSLKSLSSY